MWVIMTETYREVIKMIIKCSKILYIAETETKRLTNDVKKKKWNWPHAACTKTDVTYDLDLKKIKKIATLQNNTGEF